MGTFNIDDSDDEDEALLAAVPNSAPKTLSKGFAFEEVNPVLPPPSSSRPQFAGGLLEVEETDVVDTMFDDVEDADGEEDEDDFTAALQAEVGGGDAEDDEDDEEEEDEFGQALEDAFSEQPSTAPQKIPISLNAWGTSWASFTSLILHLG